MYPVANCDFEAPSYKQYGTGFPLTAVRLACDCSVGSVVAHDGWVHLAQDGMEFYFKQYVEGTKYAPHAHAAHVAASTPPTSCACSADVATRTALLGVCVSQNRA